MKEFLEKLQALFPEDYKRWEKIIDVRKEHKTFDKVIGKTDDGKDIHFTNDPEKMFLCGARIQSSYSPSSPSFRYLPSFVLQPYIGMVYITDGLEYYIPTDKGDIVAPNYLARAFVLLIGCHRDRQIGYVMPTYTDDNKWYGIFEGLCHNDTRVLHTNTPPIEIHLDCIEQYKQHDGTVIICGHPITPLEYRQARFNYYKGVK